MRAGTPRRLESDCCTSKLPGETGGTMILKHAPQTRAMHAWPEDEAPAPSCRARRLHWLVAAGEALALSVTFGPLRRTGTEGAAYVSPAVLGPAIRGFY